MRDIAECNEDGTGDPDAKERARSESSSSYPEYQEMSRLVELLEDSALGT